ncbi:MAG: hypothetical protein QNJ36_16660 [Calothrix sp. MO_167.B42]|nr:hypothetical protein [Calothrix sp. MO_167.B42]
MGSLLVDRFLVSLILGYPQNLTNVTTFAANTLSINKFPCYRSILIESQNQSSSDAGTITSVQTPKIICDRL